MNTTHYSTCPICQSTHFSTFLRCTDYTVSQETFEIQVCKHCQVGITQDMPSADGMGRYYKSEKYISHSDTKKGIVNRLYHFARQRMLRNKLHLIKKETGKGMGKLADIGCGTGYFPNIMQQHGWKTKNADADTDARRFAKNHFGLQVHTPTELFSEISDCELDVVTMWHVLEHVHTINQYLSEIHRMLKKDGVCFIAVPNYQSYDAQHYKDTWAGWDVPRHLWHFSQKSMKILAEKHDFEVIKLKTMPFDPFYVSLLSEKYKGSSLALFLGFFYGLLSFVKGIQNINLSSSIIYILRKKNTPYS